MGLFTSIFEKNENENDDNDEDYDEHIDNRGAIRPPHPYSYEFLKRQIAQESKQSYTYPAVSDMSKIYANREPLETEKDSLRELNDLYIELDQELNDLHIELDDLKNENRALKKHILDIKAKLS